MRTANYLRKIVLVACLTAAPFGVGQAWAQNTNAYDVAANYSTFSGNNGFGFGPWVVNTPGGGSYIANDAGSHPKSFGLWNNTANQASTANRTFNTPLAPGSVFSCDFRLANLDSARQTNGFMLQDASGNVVFSFYHLGGDNNDGWYLDAAGYGVATGFSYNFNNFTHLRFLLTSSTTYTFTNDTTGSSFSGTVSGEPITQVTFFRGNGEPPAPGNGQDFKFDTLMITSPAGTPPAFASQPANSMGFVGGTVTLGAVALSSEPISYQWYFSNAPIASATATNLVFSNLSFTNAGSYFLVASNTLGIATSTAVVVTVLPAGFTNAYDLAANYSSFSGNQGFGFGAWVLNTAGGGSYINGNPNLFAIWNNTIDGISTATRPFNAALPVNGTFLVQLQMNTLDNGNTNELRLQDADGNVLFSFFHLGGDENDGWYTDASGTGIATGFPFDYQQVDSYAFTLTSPTSYTFYNLTRGASFSGTLSGAPITQVTFARGNGFNSPSSGQDLKFNQLTIVSPTGNPPQFTLHPQYNGGLVGGALTLTGLATSSVGSPTYQWYSGNTAIAGATNSTLSLSNLTLAHSGAYQLVAANAFGSSTSTVAVVTVFVEASRLLAQESFEYAGDPTPIDNASQDGGLGWSGAWSVITGTGNFVIGGSLLADTNAPAGYDSLSRSNSYYNYGSSRAGRFLDVSTNSAFAARGYLDAAGFIGAAGKTIYVSFLMQPDVTTLFYEFEFHRANLNDPGRIAGIGNDTGSTNVFFRRPAGGFVDLGLGDSFEDPSYGNHAVNLYVVRIDFQPGDSDNVLIYRNPTSLTEPVAPTVAITNVGNMSFNGFSLGAFGNYLAIDEIRVGATWADAVGLPGAINMVSPSKQGANWIVQFAGNPAFTYRVQRATDLMGPWTDLGTATPAESGLGTFYDTNPPTTQAFYRVVTP
jgi:hypothetical protein